jgi:hypothetical protein
MRRLGRGAVLLTVLALTPRAGSGGQKPVLIGEFHSGALQGGPLTGDKSA